MTWKTLPPGVQLFVTMMACFIGAATIVYVVVKLTDLDDKEVARREAACKKIGGKPALYYSTRGKRMGEVIDIVCEFK